MAVHTIPTVLAIQCYVTNDFKRGIKRPFHYVHGSVGWELRQIPVGQVGRRGYGPPLVHVSGDQLGWLDLLEMAGMAHPGPHV